MTPELRGPQRRRPLATFGMQSSTRDLRPDARAEHAESVRRRRTRRASGPPGNVQLSQGHVEEAERNIDEALDTQSGSSIHCF